MEAKAALQRSIESVRQGRSIMAFTVVTIFFVCLVSPFSFSNAVVSLTCVSIVDVSKFPMLMRKLP